MLREAHAGDEDARALWREYATTMHGRQQQVWSNGLKAAVGIGEVEDEDAAAGEEYSEDQDETLHSFDRAEWRHWRRWRAAILAAGRRGGDAVAALLRDGPQRTETECEVIEDDPPAPVSMPRPTIPAGGLAAQAMAAIGQGAQRRAGPGRAGSGAEPQPPAGTNR